MHRVSRAELRLLNPGVSVLVGVGIVGLLAGLGVGAVLAAGPLIWHAATVCGTCLIFDVEALRVHKYFVVWGGNLELNAERRGPSSILRGKRH